jgi:YidC/Oxa1 family membrane protein insertase
MQQLGQEEPGISRNLIIAFLLIGVILGAWSLLMPPAPPAPRKTQAGPAKQDPKAPAASTAAPAAIEAPGSPEAPPAVAAGEAEQAVVLENSNLRLSFSSKGAVLTSAILKGYKDPKGVPDDLVSPVSPLAGRWPLALATGDAAYDQAANGALFHVERLEDGGGRGAVFTYSDGAGTWVRKEFRLAPDGYSLRVDLAAGRGGKVLDAVPVSWGLGFGALSAVQAKDTYNKQEWAAFSNGVAFKKVDKEKKPAQSKYTDDGPYAWAAMTNNYFAAVFVPDKPAPWVRVESAALTPEQKKNYPTETALSLDVAFPGGGTIQFIPKEWERLRTMGGTYPKLQDWGWMTPICAVLLWGMRYIHSVTANWGVAIILLTFIIRLLFFPLTQKSMVKMREMGEQMKRLKPQIDRIKSKYAKMPKGMETRSKLNEETMALYQREGINPIGGMAGCLPILLQMPIFFALFTMLPRAMELRGAPFVLWIHDLSVYDPYFITPILMGASMAATTVMTPSQLEGPQKAMMWFMPLIFTWFCIWAPAGLTLYWLVNNLLSIAQQAFVNRVAEAKKVAEAKERKSTPKGPSKKS